MMPTKDEMDSFWDIDKLIPKKKTLKPFAQEIKCTELSEEKTISAPKNSEGSLRLSFSEMTSDTGTEKQKDREYTPRNNKFIKSVRITHSLDRYDFYGNFRKAALIYHDYRTRRCDYVPFYSYMPQYSQLSESQKNYYFFWRDEVRAGRYPKTDYSYITLMVFEILNLSDKIPPQDGLKLLCALWINYRKSFSRVDTDLCTWIEDYCLVHGLDAPCEELSEIIGDIMAISSLKELWFSDFALMSRVQRNILLCAISEYDWKKGRYAAQGKASYERHMLGAMGAVISDLWYSGDMLDSVKCTEHMRRVAFPKSICTHSVKCTLDIEYYPLSASALRDKITVAVRYCENKLRALMGVKSRLAIKDMDPYFAYIIDKYFDSVYRSESEKRRAEQMPEYEKLYDAPTGEMSLAGAMSIEESSWVTTARLVSEDTEELAFYAEPIPEKPAEAPAAPCGDMDTALSVPERALLEELLSGQAVLVTLENTAKVERINEAFLELLGDIVIESDGDGYVVIEDYREDIERILK